MKKLIILISNKGSGTNLQAIIDGIRAGKINAKISAVISDTEDALGLQRAKKNKLKIYIVQRKEDLLATLDIFKSDYICLAGWKQIILDEVIDAYPNRILNIHPGLIPDSIDSLVKNPDGTIGLWNKCKLANKAIQEFLDKRSTYAGSTVHFLSKELDLGPVLGRIFEKIKEKDSVDSLYKRLKIKENKLYKDVLAKLCDQYNQKILIIDGGGRGAALVDKYGQSKHVSKIFVIPGNDLMQINTNKKVITFPGLKTTSVQEIIDLCKKERINIIDVAQDNAVEIGLVDILRQAGFNVIGPTRAAGQIEWDKAWTRNFCVKYSIRSPAYNIFHTTEEGIDFVKKQKERQYFIKASGLAEGKGAIYAENMNKAILAIQEMSRFGKSGETYLIEEFLIGKEFSAFAICDGKDFKLIGYAQDYKRVYDGNNGPNTGGMGCMSNPPFINSNIKKQVQEIFQRTINGLIKESRPYTGILYLGGMIVNNKVYVIEFNARWGDPEAEVIIPSIENDFIDIVNAVIFRRLKDFKIKIDNKPRIVVAATAKGYPVDYSLAKGKKIYGINVKKLGVKIYGAGIKKIGKNYVVNGGRILHLMAEGKNITEARNRAYKAMSLISIDGNNLHYRTDIGL